MVRIEEQVVLGGRYRLVGRIASGGMGSVWRADDLVLHRAVALKILSDSLSQDAKFVERFRREARAAAGLSHPNVAGVYDYGEEGELPFIVMELVDGETLAHRLAREGRLHAGEAARIAVQAAEALQAAHDAGVVHRDVKPANIMLTARGHVKVMDFGIAAATGAVPLTATGTTMGTASYLSPEQAGGDRATPLSEVYALGCVLYEMLAGRPPFSGDSAVAVAAAHLHEQPAPIRTLVPEIPGHVADAVDLALSKEPAGRPGSARMFAQMLGDSGVPTALPGGPPVAGVPGATQVLPSAEPTARLAPVTPAPLPAGRTQARSPAVHRRRRLSPVVWSLLVLLAVVAVVGSILYAVTTGGRTPAKTNHHSPSPSASVQVPQVVGLSFDQAASQIRDAGLVPVAHPVKGPQGVVLGVRPDQGSTVKRGYSVTVYVGNGDEGHGKGKDHGKGNGEGD